MNSVQMRAATVEPQMPAVNRLPGSGQAVTTMDGSPWLQAWGQAHTEVMRCEGAASELESTEFAWSELAAFAVPPRPAHEVAMGSGRMADSGQSVGSLEAGPRTEAVQRVESRVLSLRSPELGAVVDSERGDGRGLASVQAMEEGTVQKSVEHETLPAVSMSRKTAVGMHQEDVSPATVAKQAIVRMGAGAQHLVHALAQRIHVQQTQGADVATVRLDPPQMGQLEIRIRHDVAGGVHVQLQASHTDVSRQLASVVEQLRQELQLRSGEVQVTVAHSRSMQGGEQGREHGRQQQVYEEPAIGQALRVSDGLQLS